MTLACYLWCINLRLTLTTCFRLMWSVVPEQTSNTVTAVLLAAPPSSSSPPNEEGFFGWTKSSRNCSGTAKWSRLDSYNYVEEQRIQSTIIILLYVAWDFWGRKYSRKYAHCVIINVLYVPDCVSSIDYSVLLPISELPPFLPPSHFPYNNKN